jgi:hypothetical protein
VGGSGGEWGHGDGKMDETGGFWRGTAVVAFAA